MGIINPDDDSNQNDWHQHNQAAWDELAAAGHPLTKPAEDHLFTNPLRGVDPPRWLGDSIQGKRVLCLAAGGGRHAPLYAAAGASVVVLDLSNAMLKLDRAVATQRRLDLKTVQSSMEDLSMFENCQFDLVIHPVSTCYIPDVVPVYREVARVLCPGGLYISQHKQPASLQAEQTPQGDGYVVSHPYYRQEALPDYTGKSQLRESGTREYLHRWEQLLGEMCRAGFWIEDFLEPMHAKPSASRGSLGHRSQYIAPYLRVKARRVGGDERGPEGLVVS